MAANELLVLLSEEEKLKKQKAYEESVAKRHEERKAKMDKRKTKNEHKPEETQDYYWKEFNSQNSDIETLFEQICDSAEPTSLIKEIDVKIGSLQKYMNDSILFLNPFDLRISQSTLQKLQSDLSREREKYAPRKKFGFKSRPKKAENGTSELPKVEPIPPQKEAPTPASMPESKNSFILKDRKQETIVVDRDLVLNKDLLILNLDSCSLTIHSVPTTLLMTNVTNSTVSIGPLKTSIMIHDSINTKFSLACQQLRIHTSKQCDFYIHVTSRAIIEDSTELRFAPFNFLYPNIGEDYLISGLDRGTNNWEIVNDFNWLSSNEVSPNWSLIREEERIIWSDT